MNETANSVWAWKEFRALFPLWLACLIPIAARDQVSGWFLPTIATLAYGFGSVALGAQAIGHEYGYGTLGALLAQPARRRWIYAVKITVLAVLLGTLWFAASLTLFDEREFRSATGDPPPHLAPIVALSALGLAPALTMATRSWIAGAVFTIGIPGLLWLALSLIGVARFGPGAAGEIGRFTEAAFWPAMYVVCATAAAASWWMFARLQALEGPGTEIHLRLWRRGPSAARPADSARRPRAVGQLIAKELHLHQMTFVVAGLYVLGVLAAAAVRALNPGIRVDPVVALTVLYVLTIASLLGSFASAGERQLGTHEWQLLAPVAAWKQWMVKLGVVFALVAALALGLAAALSPLTPGIRTDWAREWEHFVAFVAVLTASCVYVSSVSTSGVRALLVTFPILFGAGYLLMYVDLWTFQARRRFDLRPPLRPAAPDWIAMLLTIATVCIPLVVLAYRNHRSAERSWLRVAAQAASLIALLAIARVAAILLGI